jgi:hypothetical protein
VSGDFNHTDISGGSLGLQQWFFVAQEMSLPTQVQTHTQNGVAEKIDFSFAGRDRFGDGALGTCSWQSNSDHKYCIGNFTI